MATCITNRRNWGSDEPCSSFSKPGRKKLDVWRYRPQNFCGGNGVRGNERTAAHPSQRQPPTKSQMNSSTRSRKPPQDTGRVLSPTYSAVKCARLHTFGNAYRWVLSNKFHPSIDHENITNLFSLLVFVGPIESVPCITPGFLHLPTYSHHSFPEEEDRF